MPGYETLDHPVLLKYLFYPRKEHTPCPAGAFDLDVPVEEGVSICCRFYAGDGKNPWLLFFHGNGEVVSDYDDIAPLYNQKGINLVVADFRGYGGSSGVPTFSSLVNDAGIIYDAVKDKLSQEGFRDDLRVMGRSMGSIPALELAYQHGQLLKGLIIESGFISAVRLVKHLGLPAMGLDLDGLDEKCLQKVMAIEVPVLLIHGQVDELVPLREARELHENLGSARKELLVVQHAGHNDILMVGLSQYFEAIRKFMADSG